MGVSNLNPAITPRPVASNGYVVIASPLGSVPRHPWVPQEPCPKFLATIPGRHASCSLYEREKIASSL